MQTDPVLKDRARAMRRAMTEPETRLWLELRDRRLQGVKFSRQVVIGSFIADFCARSVKLIVEVDGDTHADAAHDGRTAALEAKGYRVIRFGNNDVIGKLEGVLQTLITVLEAAPHPTLSPEGRGLQRSCASA
jgi:very-short-patch-repair endonuclease